MGAVILYQEHDWIYEVDPEIQSVAAPERAQDRHASEMIRLGLQDLGAFLLYPLVGIAILALAWLVLMALSRLMSLAPFENMPSFVKYVALSVVLALGWYFLGPVIMALPYEMLRWPVRPLRAGWKFVRAIIHPRRTTPLATLRTFFNSIQDGAYARAYNCLSDTAQTAHFEYPKTTYLQSQMIPADFESVDQFRRYWSQVKTQFSFQVDPAEGEERAVDTETVRIELPVTLTIRDGKNTRVYETTSAFILVKRGNFWFLANGFL
jgi:hypothetical protein